MRTNAASQEVPTARIASSHDGTKVALHELGGAGPDLIICHATGFHGRAYQPLAAALAEDFTVWAIDMRGHGAAEQPATDLDWKRMAEDLLACIDELGGGPVFAFGHSMGGAAILLAELARPGAIRSAYVYEPIVFPEHVLEARSENPLAGPTRRRREVFPSKEAALARFASRPPLNIFRADALYAYVQHGFVERSDGTVQLACRADDEADTYESEGYATIERIQGLPLQVTVAAGGMGLPPNPAQFAPAIAGAVTGATLLLYDDLGHFGPFQSPETIARDTMKALASSPAPTAEAPRS